MVVLTFYSIFSARNYDLPIALVGCRKKGGITYVFTE